MTFRSVGLISLPLGLAPYPTASTALDQLGAQSWISYGAQKFSGTMRICDVSSLSPLFSTHPNPHPVFSSAANKETSEDCRSCLECSRDNGCVRCPERLFLFLQREGMSHHGTCLHACPAGHYGQRGKDINRCMSMFVRDSLTST